MTGQLIVTASADGENMHVCNRFKHCVHARVHMHMCMCVYTCVCNLFVLSAASTRSGVVASMEVLIII